MPKKKLKETKYCLLLKQGKVIVEESIFSVERIYVNTDKCIGCTLCK